MMEMAGKYQMHGMLGLEYKENDWEILKPWHRTKAPDILRGV